MESTQLFDFFPRNPSTGRLMVIVDEDDEDLGSPSSPSLSESSSSTVHDGDAPSSSDIADDATSSYASTATNTGGSLLDGMSDLIEDLPVRRGLSRHYKGKSQSFTSLANARCLQDLVKPARRMPPPSKPAMRPCRSYAAGLDVRHHANNNNTPHSPKASIAKRPVRNTSFHAPRTPMHPHSAGNLAAGQPQPMLFA